ncbi:hypothetical protein [Glaciihabitans sp. UYNi722]|uniref:hypothetical protein n=1 Tax=Glaciihabitans sp. UYNi722 TaxID=3156344 RepID=UPI0033990488
MNFSGAIIDRSLLLLLAALIAILAYVVLRRSAKLAVTVWVLTICFVPVWIGVGIGFSGSLFLPLASVTAVLVVAALLPAARLRIDLADGLVLLLLVVSVAALLTGNRPIALDFLATFAIYYLVGYLLGRLAPSRVDVEWIYGVIAVVFTIVALLGIVEFLSGVNFFVEWKSNNSLFTAWSSIQERGGFKRAEGAFGHSIAFGASLALAIPLTLASRFRFWIRGSMVLVMLTATALTFSRIGIVGALLGLVLSVLFLRDAMSVRMRVVAIIVGTVAVLSFSPLVGVVFTGAGDEATISASYRGDLISLVPDMNVIGVSDIAHRGPGGQIYFGDFQSIDSQLVLTGLSSGLLIVIAVLIALIAAIALVLTRRASAPTIAVVAQIPAFATAAMITQYAILVWFVIGLAVATQIAARKHTASDIAAGLEFRPTIMRTSRRSPHKRADPVPTTL